MFGLNVQKIIAANGANQVNYASLQPARSFVKESFGFTPSLDRPVAKSNFTADQLCGAPLKAEHLDLIA